MKKFVLFFCLLLSSLQIPAHSKTFDYSLTQPMAFYTAGTGGNCDTCRWIVAEGTISSDTPALFERFIFKKQRDGSIPRYLHINSPGGQLFAAIKLGELYRKHELSIFVAKTLGELDQNGTHVDDRMVPRDEAICASACVIAFAGGKRRLAVKDHYANAISVNVVPKILVHQFYSADALVDPAKAQFSGLDRSADQVVSGLLLEYFNSMGVSSNLFQLMSRVAPTDPLHEMTDKELLESGLENVLAPLSVELLQVGKDALAIEVSRNSYDSQITTLISCDRNRHPVFETRIVTPDQTTIENLKEWSMYGDMILKTEKAEVPLTALNLKVEDERGETAIFMRHAALDIDIKKLVTTEKFNFEAVGGGRYASEAAWALSFALPKKFRGLSILPRTCAR
jgi:hypothetical protein